MTHPDTDARPDLPAADAREADQSPLPQWRPPPLNLSADAAMTRPISDAATAQTILHDLVLQAAHRAWQVQQRAHADALALQARNAHD